MTIKMLLPLLALILSLSVPTKAQAESAQPTVVLLTSLKSPKIWYRPSTWDLNSELEQNFRKAYDNSGYRLVVIHNASAVDLAQALRAPENVGVFWVSHAAAGDDNGKSALGRDDVILDINGENVKDVFQTIHPNLRFLAIVGCEAETIINEYQASGMYQFNPNLNFTYFKKPIDAIPSLTYALNQSNIVLGSAPSKVPADDNADNLDTSSDSYSSIPKIRANQAIQNASIAPCQATQTGIVMSIRRTIDPNVDSNSLTPAMVYLGDHFLTILAQPKPGDSQEKTVFISNDILKAELEMGAGNLELNVSSGFDGLPTLRPTFGSFSFQSGLGNWDLFVDKKGNPIGVTSILYSHSGQIQAIPANQFVMGMPLGCQ